VYISYNPKVGSSHIDTYLLRLSVTSVNILPTHVNLCRTYSIQISCIHIYLLNFYSKNKNIFGQKNELDRDKMTYISLTKRCFYVLICAIIMILRRTNYGMTCIFYACHTTKLPLITLINGETLFHHNIA
jgi:hypothetical protein